MVLPADIQQVTLRKLRMVNNAINIQANEIVPSRRSLTADRVASAISISSGLKIILVGEWIVKSAHWSWQVEGKRATHKGRSFL